HLRHLHSFPTRRSSYLSENQKPKTESNSKREIRNQFHCERNSVIGFRDSCGFRISNFGFERHTFPLRRTHHRPALRRRAPAAQRDRKSTRLNSSHVEIS